MNRMTRGWLVLVIAVLPMVGCAQAVVLGPRMVETPTGIRTRTVESLGPLEVRSTSLSETAIKAEVVREQLCQTEQTTELRVQEFEDRDVKGLGPALTGAAVLLIGSAVLIGLSPSISDEPTIHQDGSVSSARSDAQATGGLGLGLSLYWLYNTISAAQQGRDRPQGEPTTTQRVELVGGISPCGQQAAEAGELAFFRGTDSSPAFKMPSSSQIDVKMPEFSRALCSSLEHISIPLHIRFRPSPATSTEDLLIGTWHADACIKLTVASQHLDQALERLNRSSMPRDVIEALEHLRQADALLSTAPTDLLEQTKLVRRQLALNQEVQSRSTQLLEVLLKEIQETSHPREPDSYTTLALACLELSAEQTSHVSETWITLYSPLVRDTQDGKLDSIKKLALLLGADIRTQKCLKSPQDCDSSLRFVAMQETLAPAIEHLKRFSQQRMTPPQEEQPAQRSSASDNDTLTQQKNEIESLRALYDLCLSLTIIDNTLTDTCDKTSQSLQYWTDAHNVLQSRLEQQRIEQMARERGVQLSQQAEHICFLLEREGQSIKIKPSEAQVSTLKSLLNAAAELIRQCSAHDWADPNYRKSVTKLELTYQQHQAILLDAQAFLDTEAREKAEKVRQERITKTAKAWRSQFKTCVELQKLQTQLDLMKSCTGPCLQALTRARKDWERLEAFSVPDALWDEVTKQKVRSECHSAGCPTCP